MSDRHSPPDASRAIQSPRYSRRPFPRYRYRPGLNPHPTASADGHSFRPPAASEPPIKPIILDQWRECGDYLYGCDLYNHGYWWEAHEAWEGLWREAGRSTLIGDFLQGLIQASACHFKIHQGNVRGSRRLIASADGYLNAVEAQILDRWFMGLDLRDWRLAVKFYAETVAGGSGACAHRPDLYPYLVLGEGSVD
jgi:hypothetical protein